MSMRPMQGWALILSALLSLLGILHSDSPAIRAVLVVGGILLILGVPAIGAVLRFAAVGWLGIILVELAAALALVMSQVASGAGAGMSDVLPLVAALAGAVGWVIVGWLTTRQSILPAWPGWVVIVESVLNLLGGLVAVPALSTALGVIVPLLGAAALIGYGLGIVRHEAAAAPLAEPMPVTGKK